MKRLLPRKSRELKKCWLFDRDFWKIGAVYLIVIDIFLILNCVGSYQHLREIESYPITEYKVVEKKVEVPVEKIIYKYINRKTTTTRTANVEQWRPLVAKYFGSQTDNALRVMACESGGNTMASSRTDDHGLMQINGRTWCGFFGVSREQLKDPETNIKLAYVIYQRGGWRPWTCSRKVGIN